MEMQSGNGLEVCRVIGLKKVSWEDGMGVREQVP